MMVVYDNKMVVHVTDGKSSFTIGGERLDTDSDLRYNLKKVDGMTICPLCAESLSGSQREQRSAVVVLNGHVHVLPPIDF